MPRLPKILIAAAIYPPDSGGPSIHAEAQYKWFTNQGYTTELVALSHYMKWPRGIRHFLYAINLFIKALRTNIVYAHDALGVGFIALIIARLLGQKIVLRIGGDRPWENEADQGLTNLSMKEWYEQKFYKHNTFYKLTRFVISRVDMLVVTSGLLQELYCKYYDIDPKRIKIIANPISTLVNDAQEKEQTIIFASRLVAYKNLAFVISALKTIFSIHPNLKFIIMGDGPERNRLEILSRQLQIESNVVFCGSVSHSEVISKTKKSLFTIAPALTEFNPNYVLQGISLGKPFIVSVENGFPFSVPDAFIFNPRNEQDLILKVKGLLTDHGYADAKKQLQNIHFKMTWEDNLRANEEIVRSLLCGSK